MTTPWVTLSCLIGTYITLIPFGAYYYKRFKKAMAAMEGGYVETFEDAEEGRAEERKEAEAGRTELSDSSIEDKNYEEGAGGELGTEESEEDDKMSAGGGVIYKDKAKEKICE